MHWRRKWKPTPVFLPGESLGQRNWCAAVYGVAQSWTQLKRLSSSSSSSSRVRNAGALGLFLPCWDTAACPAGAADCQHVLRLLLCRAGWPCLGEDSLVNLLSSASLTGRVDRGSASVDTLLQLSQVLQALRVG